MKQIILSLMVLLASVSSVYAQTVSADRFRLNTGPCRISSGSGAPSAGNTCDHYIDTATGELYWKRAGIWVKAPNLSSAADSATQDLVENTNSSGTSASASFRTAADVANVSYLSHGSGRTVTRYGITLGGWNEILAAGGNGVIVGTSAAKPIVLGTNNVEAWRIDSSQNTGTSNYVSQTTGWRVGPTGDLDVRFLFTNELRALLFSAAKESVYKGSLSVTKSYSFISQAFTCPGAGDVSTLWVLDDDTFGDAAVFESGDSVVIRSLTRTVFGPFTITDCIGVVTAYADGTGANAGQQSWSFTRNGAGLAGNMAGSTVVAVKELVQDMGVTTNGFIRINANDGTANANAPYLDVDTWATTPDSSHTTTRCRLGQQKGITSVSEYGLLCGDFTNKHYVRFTDVNAEVAGIALRLYDGSTETMRLDPTVPSLAMGSTLPSAFGTGTGIWFGKDTTFKFRIGDPAGNRMIYDTSGLTLVSDTLTINPGITIAAPPTGLTINYGYKFATAFSGTNVVGTFAYEPSSTQRTLDVINSTTASSKTITTSVSALSGSFGAVTVWASDGTNTYIESNSLFRPSSDNAIPLGSAARRWSDLFLGSNFTMTAFGGSGNRTVCVNNSGLFYTVASGAAC